MKLSKEVKVLIHTFGCQMNRLDTDIACESLVSSGYKITDDESEADVVLFNTCSVRDHAEERVLQRVRQIDRPGVIVGIMGCLAQRMGDELFRLLKKRLHIVCGTRRFPFIDDLVSRALAGERKVMDIDESPLPTPGIFEAHERSLHKGIQGFVSIMRGCNNFCTYCIVPYVRGREKSRPIQAVVDEVQALVDKGAVEVTLLGQNIDAYGKDIDSSLAELLRAVHENVKGLKRLRFVTSHPRDITKELLQAVNDLPKVCNHLHMPAQSGSNHMLEAMRRGYSRETYDEKLAMIKEFAPGTLVTSDFIVGFPGETEDDFLQTLELVRTSGFQTSYVFKYSPRPGTYSEKNLIDDVSEEDKKRRNQLLLQAQEESSTARNNALVGSEHEVLVEGLSNRDATRLTGRTGSNLICVFPAPENHKELIGEIVRVRVDSATALTLYTHIVC